MVWFYLSLAFLCILTIDSTESKLLKPDYGNRPVELRITGVSDLKDGLAPYQCSLQKNSKHFCGCVIIAPDWILTAAQCFNSKRLQDIQILVGTNQLSWGGAFYRVKKRILHENFGKLQFDEEESGRLRYANDIGLIQTETTIEFNKKVQPIEYSLKEVKVGVENLQFTGWGVLNKKGDRSDNLQVLNVTSISAEECERHSAVGTPVNSTLCTISPANKIIYGDAGGPLVHGNVLVGIANWAEASGPRVPEGYAKISHYYKWIGKIIARN